MYLIQCYSVRGTNSLASPRTKAFSRKQAFKARKSLANQNKLGTTQYVQNIISTYNWYFSIFWYCILLLFWYIFQNRSIFHDHRQCQFRSATFQVRISVHISVPCGYLRVWYQVGQERDVPNTAGKKPRETCDSVQASDLETLSLFVQSTSPLWELLTTSDLSQVNCIPWFLSILG